MTLSPDLLMSFFPPGAVAGQLLLMYMCSLPSNNRLWEKQHPLLAMSCKLVLSTSCLPMHLLTCRLAGLCYSSCNGSPGVSQRTPSQSLALYFIGHRVGCPDASVCTKQLFHKTAIALACGGESGATIGPLATLLTNSSLLSGRCNLITIH